VRMILERRSRAEGSMKAVTVDFTENQKWFVLLFLLMLFASALAMMIMHPRTQLLQ